MQPNILLIVSDQHRLDCVGASNDYPVRTPNIDRLAREGAWFRQAYTPIPLCTPARQSMLTGRRPEVTGGLWNYDLGPRIPALGPESYSWPRGLAAAGYRSIYVGKWHVSPDHDPVDFGYDEYVPLEAYDQWRETRHPGQGLPQDWFGAVDPLPASESRTHWLARQVSEFIADASKEQKPWHARLDFLEPHLPCQPSADFAARYSPEKIPQWRSFQDDFRNKPYIQRQQLLNWGVEDYQWDDWAPVVARYYAIIEQMDDAIGTVLSSLDDADVADDTLVIYTTDHGDMCGSHGMMDKHYVMYDDVVRVPLAMRWPTRIGAGVEVDAFTYNTLDLPPTISSLVDIAPPSDGHGVALFDRSDRELHVAPAASERTHVVSSYNGQQFGLYIQRMIRTREWKYIWNPTDVDELYNLVDDPSELNNLIADDAAQAQLHELRLSLLDQLRKDGDSFVANSWMVHQLTSGRKLPLPDR